MKKLIVFSAMVLTGIVACGSDDRTPTTGLPGSDRDEHGCIGSAGYSWCSRTSQCERPWELAKQEKFTNSPEAFERYCGQSGD